MIWVRNSYASILTVCLEATPPLEAREPTDGQPDHTALRAGLGDHVGICFDVGHSNANVPDPVEEIRAAGENIFCVHIQDNDGKGEDQHLVPGEGTVNWPAVLAALDRYAPESIWNFEIALKDRDLDELLATLAALRKEWTGE